MNIKNKANLHFKLFPVIYEENQYACTISAAKSYIGKLLYLSFILIGLVGTAAFFMRNDIFENVIIIVMSLGLVLLLVIVIWSCLVIVIWSCLEILSQESMETIELYSIGTDKGIEGRFVMGSGNIETKEVYTAYQIMNDGGKKYYKMDRDITTICENLDTNTTAYAEIYRKGHAIALIKLYVPQDTIIQDINVDL